MVLPGYLFWSAIIRFGVDGEATFSQLSRNAATAKRPNPVQPSGRTGKVLTGLVIQTTSSIKEIR